MPEPFILPAKSAYASRSFPLHVETFKMNMTANTVMGAPGEAVGTFGLECGIDELAHAMGLEPIDLRIKNGNQTISATAPAFKTPAMASAAKMIARPRRLARNACQRPTAIAIAAVAATP